ncbi:MAG: DUF3299 domain-containing protein [Vibrio anguillarum]
MNIKDRKRFTLGRCLSLKTWAFSIVIICLAGISSASAAGQIQKITWKDLEPHVEVYNDPFLKLTPDQKFDLIIVARMRQLQSEGVDISSEQLARLNTALNQLDKDQIDINGLLALRGEIAAKRKNAMEAVNEDLNKQTIRIAGYVLPLEMDGLKVTELLLVPYVGACIHEPVPPANQIVLVKFVKGIEVDGPFTPVWVQGKMNTQIGTSKLHLIDGSADIPSSYTLDADIIELY